MLFNPRKKLAKQIAWHYLRISQQQLFNSHKYIALDYYRFDPGLLMVALGAYGIYVSMKKAGLSEKEEKEFETYLFQYAPGFVRDLYKEYRETPLHPELFEMTYKELKRTCEQATAENTMSIEGAGMLFAITCALTEDYRTEEKVKEVMESYNGEITEIQDALLNG